MGVDPSVSFHSNKLRKSQAQKRKDRMHIHDEGTTVRVLVAQWHTRKRKGGYSNFKAMAWELGEGENKIK